MLRFAFLLLFLGCYSVKAQDDIQVQIIKKLVSPIEVNTVFELEENFLTESDEFSIIYDYQMIVSGFELNQANSFDISYSDACGSDIDFQYTLSDIDLFPGIVRRKNSITFPLKRSEGCELGPYSVSIKNENGEESYSLIKE